MPTTNPALRARPVSQLVIRTIAFLWQGRLPFGKLAILDGDPGLGKSFVALDLCARLSSGRPFPDGSSSPLPGPANCVYFNGEDGDDDTTGPRLQALGADLERVFVLDQSDEDIGQPLSLPSQAAALDSLLTQTGAKLVVLDPIVAFLDARVQIANDLSVRHALAPLARLAKKHQCVILLIRHLNKTGDQRALYRGGGSIAFVAACRSAWLIAADPEHEDRCILAQNKNNLAPPQPSLSYQLLVQPGQLPALSWLDGPCPFTANELLARAGRPPLQTSALDRAADFLMTLLEEGPVEAQDVWTVAQQENVSERTIKRAKRELKIRSVTVWTDGVRQSYWLLPGQEMPESIPAESIVPDLELWLAPLRERFPPSAPLDDT